MWSCRFQRLPLMHDVSCTIFITNFLMCFIRIVLYFTIVWDIRCVYITCDVSLRASRTRTYFYVLSEHLHCFKLIWSKGVVILFVTDFFTIMIRIRYILCCSKVNYKSIGRCSDSFGVEFVDDQTTSLCIHVNPLRLRI